MGVLKLGRILGVCVASLATHNVYGSYDGALHFDFTKPWDVERFFASRKIEFISFYPPLYSSPIWGYTLEDFQRSSAIRAQPPVVSPRDADVDLEESTMSYLEEALGVSYEDDTLFFTSTPPSPIVRSLENMVEKVTVEKKLDTPSEQPPKITYTREQLQALGSKISRENTDAELLQRLKMLGILNVELPVKKLEPQPKEKKSARRYYRKKNKVLQREKTRKSQLINVDVLEKQKSKKAKKKHRRYVARHKKKVYGKHSHRKGLGGM